jgi:histidine triad (HIT) family protein
MSGCVFCQIAAGHVPARIVHQDDRAVAFHDTNPQAPVHVLVIPRDHCESIAACHDDALVGHLFGVARTVAAQLKLSDYRLVVNTGASAGQSVWHLHVHLLAGRAMHWPPG